MASKRATWRPEKAAKNLAKHKVSFEEAETALHDPLARWEPDWAMGEMRFAVIGVSERGRLLFVVTIEIADNQLHIISARKAERHERKRYEQGD